MLLASRGDGLDVVGVGTACIYESCLGALHTFDEFVKCVIFDHVFGELW